MEAYVRLGKKIKIADDIYVILKKEVLKGTIDPNNCFVYKKDDGNIEKLPCYDDSKFILSTKQEYCYCDDMDVYELMRQYSTSKTESELSKKFIKQTDTTAYLMYYDRNERTIEPLSLDACTIGKILKVSEAIDDADNMSEWNDGLCASFVDDYVLTTIDTVDLLREKMENGEEEDVCINLQKVCENFDLLNNIDKVVQAGINSGENDITITYGEDDKEKKEEKIESNKSLEEIINDLNSLIGMDKVKKQINKLSLYLKFLENSKELGIKLKQPNLNMVFLGNPGTGKTTVARIISQILNKLGYANGKFKEVSAQDFIAGYVGQTALKTEKLLKEIQGGVLFVDEAYSLTLLGDDASYGSEAIAVLLKEMEKNETIFIFSGYKKEMEKFIKSNSGLTSRIGNNFDFKDYKTDELFQMFINKINKTSLILGEGVEEEIKKLLNEVTKQEDFGNGRYIDKLFDSIILEHGYNNAYSKNINELKTISLNDINREDIDQLTYKKNNQNKLGF